MLSDGEIWRPLPDEGYMPDTMGWDEVGREKNKPSERGAMRWIVGRKGVVHGHDNDLCFFVSKMIMNASCMCLI